MPLFVVPINANQVLRQIVIHSWIATATDVEALVTKGLGRRVWDGDKNGNDRKLWTN